MCVCAISVASTGARASRVRHHVLGEEKDEGVYGFVCRIICDCR